MAEGVTIRPYEAGDEAGINDGFNAVFGLSRSLQEWRWKFPEGPEGRWIMVAVGGDGMVLGHYGAVPVRFRVGALEVTAGQPVDVYTRPEGRRGLAASRLYLTTVRRFFAEFGAADRLSFLYGFPGERALRLGLARLGYDQMTPQPVRFWVRDPRRAGRWWVRHDLRFGFDRAAIDDLWQRAAGRYAVAGQRDGAWLARRFLGRPAVEYTHVGAFRGNRAHAWAVVRCVSVTASLAELIWDGDDTRALAALDRGVAALARRAGAKRLEMWLMGDPTAERALAELGWESRPHPDGLVVVARSFDPRVDVTSFPGRFYITMGDADLV